MDFKFAKNLATSLTLCFFLADSADAGKMYKIVGKDGKVTFSQYPPDSSAEDDQSTKTVEELKVATGGASRVSKNGDYEMCGNIRLPYRSSRSKSGMAKYLDSVGDKVVYWERELKRLEKITADRSRDKLASNRNSNSRYFSQEYQNTKDQNYLQRQSRDQERMRDLRCAINWGKDTRSETTDTRLELKSERERLTAIRDELENNLQNRCGDLPSYDPTDPQVTRQRSDWYSCSKHYRKEIRTVESKLKRL